MTEPEEDTVQVSRSDVRRLGRSVWILIVAGVLAVSPLIWATIDRQHVDDRQDRDSARLEALIAYEADADERAEAQVCVTSHDRYAQFTQLIGAIPAAFSLDDPGGVQALLDQYPPPTCDLPEAQERLDRRPLARPPVTGLPDA